MTKNMDNTDIKGYIEGFYGRLLDWEGRKLIIKSFQVSKLK